MNMMNERNPPTSATRKRTGRDGNFVAPSTVRPSITIANTHTIVHPLHQCFLHAARAVTVIDVAHRVFFWAAG